MHSYETLQIKLERETAVLFTEATPSFPYPPPHYAYSFVE